MAKDDKKHHKKHHVASKPTRAAPNPAPAPASSTNPGVGRTATRPTAARTPTSPPRKTDAPRHAGSDTAEVPGTRGRSAGRATRATPELGDAGAHYTRPSEVPLRPGQTLGYTAGRGYYATTRPNPTRASTTPKSRTTKIVALPTRASTDSPLKQHVETRDGKTSIRLHHATKPGGESEERRVSARAVERSAKPTQEHAHRTTVETKKASSRVHEQLAKKKERSHHAKSGGGHRPDATIAAAREADRSRDRKRRANALRDSLPAFGLTLTPPLIWARGAKTFIVTPLGVLEVNTSLQASVKGVEIELEPGVIAITWNHHKLASLSLYQALIGFKEALGRAHERLNTRQVIELRKRGAEVTVPVSGGTARFSSDGEMSFSTTHGGVTTTFGLGATGDITVTMSITERVPKPIPSVGKVPVDVTVVTTLSGSPGVTVKQPSPDTPTATAIPPAHEDLLQYFERLLVPGLGMSSRGGSGAKVPGVPEPGWDFVPVG